MKCSARQVKPEEKPANQFAARASGQLPMHQMTHPYHGAMQNAMTPGSAPAQIVARAAFFAAAAQQPTMAAQAAANAEIEHAFTLAGRRDFLPYLAPRPVTTVSGPASAATEDRTQIHLQSSLQQNQEYNQREEVEQESLRNMLAQRSQSIPKAVVTADEQVPEFERDEQILPLQIPPAGAVLPSMKDMQLKDIPTVCMHRHDVLCGRGGGTNNHPGNERFRDLVTAQKVQYLNSSKREKPGVSRNIVRAVRNQNPPGRFLQKNEQTGLWYDIGDQKAREKTSQALREGAPEIRRGITTTISVPSMQTAIPQRNFPYGGLPVDNPYTTGRTTGSSPAASPFATMQQHHAAVHQAAAAQQVAQQVVTQQQAASLQHAAAQQAMSRQSAPALGNQFQNQRTLALAAERSRLATKAYAPSGFRQASFGAGVVGRMPKSVVPISAPLGRGRGVPPGGPMPFQSGRGLGTLRPQPQAISQSAPKTSSKAKIAAKPKVTAMPPAKVADQIADLASQKPQPLSEHSRGRSARPHRRKDAQSIPPLPHDLARRLVLAETVAQKSVNGTITDDMKSEEYRIGLYMDAGLLGIHPAALAVALTQGRTESEVVEEKYLDLLKSNKRKRNEILPPCRRVPKTKGALETLGALTKRGIDDALTAIGAAPTVATS